jgi:signal transduction histidine kinase
MAERIEKIGGTLSIDSKPGDGTEIVVRWSE